MNDKTNTKEVKAKEKPQNRILELIARMSRGFKIKRKKTTEVEWSFKGSDDQSK